MLKTEWVYNGKKIGQKIAGYKPEMWKSKQPSLKCLINFYKRWTISCEAFDKKYETSQAQ